VYDPAEVVSGGLAGRFLRTFNEADAVTSVSAKQWAQADSSLKEIIGLIEEFVMPAVESLLKEDAQNKVWQPGGPGRKDRNL
jgi:hypothetical protein